MLYPKSWRAGLLAAALTFSLTSAFAATLPESLLPVFGSEGEEFTTQAQAKNTVRGWLPTGWNDNSEWAPVSATYERLVDRPDDAPGAVRINITKLDDGQLQFTSYRGERNYEAGKSYRVCGWLRSKEAKNVTVFIRQTGEPYEAFASGEVSTGTDWKPFEFSFQFAEDKRALVYLATQETGTLDVAGVSVAEGGPGPSLLPAFGTEGADIRKAAAHGCTIQGFIPRGWDDNSDWGPVNATYARIDDAPPETLSAVRIKVESVRAPATGDQGQLQLTTYAGPGSYQGGRKYQLAGWIRSESGTPFTFATRNPDEPYNIFSEKEVPAGKEWKRFTVDFSPETDRTMIPMLIVKNPGTVDFAGVTLDAK